MTCNECSRYDKCTRDKSIPCANFKEGTQKKEWVYYFCASDMSPMAMTMSHKADRVEFMPLYGFSNN